jgi:hypothetical protein
LRPVNLIIANPVPAWRLRDWSAADAAAGFKSGAFAMPSTEVAALQAELAAMEFPVTSRKHVDARLPRSKQKL